MLSLIVRAKSTLLPKSLSLPSLLPIHRAFVSTALRIVLYLQPLSSNGLPVDAIPQTFDSSVPASTAQTTTSSSTHSPPCEEDLQSRTLQRVFRFFDENGDGVVSIEEIRRGLEKLGQRLPEEQLVTLVNTASENEYGYMHFYEFKSLYKSLFEEVLSEDVPAEIQQDDGSVSDLLEAFRVFDKNADGFICVDELQTVLSNLGFSECEDLSFCEGIIRRVDANCDGRIDFSEFKQMMSSL